MPKTKAEILELCNLNIITQEERDNLLLAHGHALRFQCLNCDHVRTVDDWSDLYGACFGCGCYTCGEPDCCGWFSDYYVEIANVEITQT